MGGPGANWSEGEEFDLDDRIAKDWIVLKHVTPVGVPAEVETAVSPRLDKVEKAVRNRQAGRPS